MRSFLWQSILLSFAATSTAIFNGHVATTEDAIGVVRLHMKDTFEDYFGSGVVLGYGNCVITARHLFVGMGKDTVKVSGNKWEKNKIVRNDTEVAVSAIHAHSKHDIAVVELASNMTPSPWQIATGNGRYRDINLYGWGSISQGSRLPDELRSAVDKYRDLKARVECRDWTKLEDAGICIMSQNSTDDPPVAPPDGINCGGDSGGPGVIGGSVVGVASETVGTCGVGQTAGLLAALFADDGFLQGYETKCGFQFGGP